ncbi:MULTISPECIES: hypothetical protein [Bacillus]|uniref:hypothetical protein n=1 Tax=Bacillus TaxID=1386 RepID=UPI0001A18C2D|nr:hypothetical protein [Bacillus pseudomycoides]EEM14150.1 MORN repeat variant [Bacillus pseudomycoides DSM 12442]MED1599053.1 hypothetical protein [Bacillus pseudomycoides]MED4713185.1 hypothetical protein [Bacillus pseudomycoides]OOR48702.1 hypothetical protein BLX05_28110 [Bacillus pseudomycoides]PDY11851.1 hypothetical protein COO16_13255 [Bacillus pseudomycoides]
MLNEIKFTKKEKKIIFWVFTLPLGFSLFASYMIFGNIFEALFKMWELRGEPNKTASAVTSLSYVFTILVAIYALLATTLFSLLVWNVSKGSLQVSQQLRDLEDNRDKEMVRENALIVYYDLQRGISNLRDLYTSYVLKGIDAKPNRIYFSADWIKNVANLRDGLTSQELNRVYKLYEQFYALQNILEEHKMDKPNEELREYLDELSKEVFADFIPFPLLGELKVSSFDELVGIDLYIILQKIYCLTFASSKEKPMEKVVNGKTVYETYLNGVLFFVGDTKEPFVGDGELYNTDGKIKCTGRFDSEHFIPGIIYGYYNSTKECYEITYDTNTTIWEIKKGILYKLPDDNNQYFYNGEFKDGQVLNGITTLFHKNKKIRYQGELKGGRIDGQGTYYNEHGSVEFVGILKNGFKINGIEFINGIQSFKGEYKYSKPWNGITNNYNLSNQIKKFTGEIYEGTPINGEGLIFNRDSDGKDLDALQAYEELLEEKVEEEAGFEESPAYIEDRASFNNEEIRRNNAYWTEFIKAQWNNGVVTEADNKERNKKIYA